MAAAAVKMVRGSHRPRGQRLCRPGCAPAAPPTPIHPMLMAVPASGASQEARAFLPGQQNQFTCGAAEKCRKMVDFCVRVRFFAVVLCTGNAGGESQGRCEAVRNGRLLSSGDGAAHYNTSDRLSGVAFIQLHSHCSEMAQRIFMCRRNVHVSRFYTFLQGRVSRRHWSHSYTVIETRLNRC